MPGGGGLGTVPWEPSCGTHRLILDTLYLCPTAVIAQALPELAQESCWGVAASCLLPACGPRIRTDHDLMMDLNEGINWCTFFLNTRCIKIWPPASSLTVLCVHWICCLNSHWALFLYWSQIIHGLKHRHFGLFLPPSFPSPMKAASTCTYLLCCSKLALRWAVPRSRLEDGEFSTIILVFAQSFISQGLHFISTESNAWVPICLIPLQHLSICLEPRWEEKYYLYVALKDLIKSKPVE